MKVHKNGRGLGNKQDCRTSAWKQGRGKGDRNFGDGLCGTLRSPLFVHSSGERTNIRITLSTSAQMKPNWFKASDIAKKRRHIKNLIVLLAKELHVGTEGFNGPRASSSYVEGCPSFMLKQVSVSRTVYAMDCMCFNGVPSEV